MLIIDHGSWKSAIHVCVCLGCFEHVASIYVICVFFFVFLFFCLFAISWAAPMAYGGSEARGPIRAVATGLHHGHSNVGSKPHLRPTLQLTATADP